MLDGLNIDDGGVLKDMSTEAYKAHCATPPQI